MKRSMMALAALGLMSMSASASAANYKVTSTDESAPSFFQNNLNLLGLGDGSTFSGGSTDNLKSTKATVTNFFKITYTFTAQFTGSGIFKFITSSTSPAALLISSFQIGNGPKQPLTPSANSGNNINYSGDAPIVLAKKESQSFTLYGSINRNGTISTTASFAAAVPELSTWVMMIMGVGMVGTAFRVRRHQIRYSLA